MITMDSSFAEKYADFKAWSLNERKPEDYERYLIRSHVIDRLYYIAEARNQDLDELLTSLEQDAFGG